MDEAIDLAVHVLDFLLSDLFKDLGFVHLVSNHGIFGNLLLFEVMTSLGNLFRLLTHVLLSLD